MPKLEIGCFGFVYALEVIVGGQNSIFWRWVVINGNLNVIVKAFSSTEAGVKTFRMFLMKNYELASPKM